MTQDRFILWSDIDLDFNDWRGFLENEYPDDSESKLIERMYDINAERIEYTRDDLNIRLSQPIIIIGDLGLWRGRVSGYKMINSGNIKDCLYADCEMAEWYVDKRGDLRCEAIHHDGTNHYLYRVFKDGVTERQISTLQEKIYMGKATRADITRVTKRLGDEINKVYGLNLPYRKERQLEAVER